MTLRVNGIEGGGYGDGLEQEGPLVGHGMRWVD